MYVWFGEGTDYVWTVRGPSLAGGLDARQELGPR
jgi:hypothetical protein